jgi:uroporphyrinogen-III synthase
MSARLDGQRVALFESRLAAELSELVRRCGGVPVCVPAVVERRLPSGPEVRALLTALRVASPAVFVFSTGVGARALFDEARSQGLAPELLEAISRGEAVCRGPKAVAALYREGRLACRKARSPYTTVELVDALAEVEVCGRTVVLVHHGGGDDELVEALVGRGARVHELLVYDWQLPEDTSALEQAARELAQGEFAAAAFTTQIQARHLMTIACRIGCHDTLVASLRSRVVVAAVGPTCARVLTELGVPAQVVADPPKMATMVGALVARLTVGSGA